MLAFPFFLWLMLFNLQWGIQDSLWYFYFIYTTAKWQFICKSQILAVLNQNDDRVRSRYILVLSSYIYIFITNIHVKYCWLIFFSISLSWVYIPEKIFSLDQKSYISWIFTIFLFFNLLPWDYTRRIVFTKYSVKELFRVFVFFVFLFFANCAI